MDSFNRNWFLDTIFYQPDRVIDSINKGLYHPTWDDLIQYLNGDIVMNDVIDFLFSHMDFNEFDEMFLSQIKNYTALRQILSKPQIKELIGQDPVAYNIILENLFNMSPKIITNEAQLVELSDRFTAKAINSRLFNVQLVYSVLAMIKHGFFPEDIYPRNVDEKFIAYVTGMDPDTFTFWFNGTIDRYENFLFTRDWDYYTIETYKEKAVKNVISLPLLLYAPELVYRESKRPKTDMAMFRNPNSLTASLADVKDDKILINGEEWKTITVTRYAEGMSKGLYYSDTPSHFCGTFYYYEPESTTLLTYQKGATFFNKYDCYLKLNEMLGRDPVLLDTNNKSLEIFFKHYNKKIPLDLKLTPIEAHNLGIGARWDLERISALPQVPRYAGKELGLYAFEDTYDQVICTMGKELGLDIIILEYMVGSNQVVTEVLDTRNRVDSFRNLVYLI